MKNLKSTSAKHFSLSLSAVAVSLMLSACGGGGGSTSTPTPPPPVAQTCANGASDYPTCTPAVTPAKLQLTVPVPPYAAGSEDLKAFNFLNDVRQKMGLGLLAYSAELTKAAENHANYLVLNKGVGGHNEDPLKPGFTGATAEAQVKFAGYATNYRVGGNLGQANSKAGVMQGFLNTVYHRTSVLNQHYTDHGFASFCISCEYTYLNVANFLSSKDAGQSNASDFVTFYPMDKQTDVNLTFGESPNPFPVEYPDGLFGGHFGFPVTFYVQENQVLNLKTFTMTEAGQTTPLDAFVRTNANDPNAVFVGKNEAYLVAKAKLKPTTTYNISVTATVNGKDIARNWSFTTAESNKSI